MSEPRLTGLFIVGGTHFKPGVSLSTAQGAVDRLVARYKKYDAALLQVKEYSHRLPPELAKQIDTALSLSGQ